MRLLNQYVRDTHSKAPPSRRIGAPSNLNRSKILSTNVALVSKWNYIEYIGLIRRTIHIHAYLYITYIHST